MKKTLKWTGLSFVVILLLLQFIQPARTNPPVQKDMIATLNPPAPVAAGLRAACYDCHSHETKWPLYARISPSSWLVVSDVNEGREHLDLSAWPDDPAGARKKLDRINEVLDYREMPPRKYTLMHPEARLTEDLRKQIMDWTDAAAAALKTGSTNQ